MRRRKDDVHGSETRDLELGRALEELDAPEYPLDFLAGVWARVDAGEGAADGAVPALSPRRAYRTWFRRPAFVATATVVAVAAVVAVTFFVGMPSISRMSGPEPASAAQVIQKALRAMSSGTTLVMSITEKDLEGYARGGEAAYKTTHVRLAMRSDGSYRLVQTDVAPASAAKGRPRKGYEGGVYDAPTGVFRHYVMGWEEDAGRYMREAEVTTGRPLGPPDSWVSMESGLQSVALALRSAGRATVTATSFAGRPVWVISAIGVMALRDRTERQHDHDRQADLPAAPRAGVEGWRPPGRVHVALRQQGRAGPEGDLHDDPDEAHEVHVLRRRLPQVVARQDRGDAGPLRPPADPVAGRLSLAVGRCGRALDDGERDHRRARRHGAAVRAWLRRPDGHHAHRERPRASGQVRPRRVGDVLRRAGD